MFNIAKIWRLIYTYFNRVGVLMMARRKKAFTLIELLAVIVIIGIISLITVPAIMDIINKGQKMHMQNRKH